MADATDLLARVDLFSDLLKGELKNLAGAAKEYRFEAGREIVIEGTSGVGFFVIETGNATVSIGGTEVRVLGPGDHFGEVALVADVARTATVTAATDLTCWGITSWAFRPIVEKNPALAWKLLQVMAHLVESR